MFDSFCYFCDDPMKFDNKKQVINVLIEYFIKKNLFLSGDDPLNLEGGQIMKSMSNLIYVFN